MPARIWVLSSGQPLEMDVLLGILRVFLFWFMAFMAFYVA